MVANNKTRSNSAGFTIVELMIALTVLSTILVIATMLMTQIGRLYMKGVTQADVQNAARNISADLVASLQFSGSPPAPYTCDDPADPQGGMVCYSHKTVGTPTIYSYCIDTTRYSFILDRELGSDTTKPGVNHVLWKDKVANSANCTPLDITTAGTPSGSDPSGFEMVPNRGRLVRFKVFENPVNSRIYTVDLNLAFGDSDLLNVDTSNGDANCISGAGSQFCGTSSLRTDVLRRIEVQ